MRSNACQCDELERCRAQQGFTLLEVVVVMAVVAILAAVAIPNYSEYIMRSHRSEAQSFISDVASRQSQFFLDRRSYAATVADLSMTVPAEVAARYTVAMPSRGSAGRISSDSDSNGSAGYRSLWLADDRPGGHPDRRRDHSVLVAL